MYVHFITRMRLISYTQYTSVHILTCMSLLQCQNTRCCITNQINYFHPTEMYMYRKLTIMAPPTDGYKGPHLTLGSLQYFNYFFVTFLHCYDQSCFSSLKVNLHVHECSHVGKGTIVHLYTMYMSGSYTCMTSSLQHNVGANI